MALSTDKLSHISYQINNIFYFQPLRVNYAMNRYWNDSCDKVERKMYFPGRLHSNRIFIQLKLNRL